MNSTDKRFWTIIVIFVIIAGLILWDSHHKAYAPAPSDMETMSTSTDIGAAADVAAVPSVASVFTYACDAGKSITATLHLPADDFANVHLSDGRDLILAHVVSADGARYANANESIVFWTKGNTAFVTENGTTTYSGCVTNS